MSPHAFTPRSGVTPDVCITPGFDREANPASLLEFGNKETERAVLRREQKHRSRCVVANRWAAMRTP